MTKRFIKLVANIIASKGNSRVDMDLMWYGYDCIILPNRSADEAFCVALQDMEIAMCNSKCCDIRCAAKRIKEILRDCGMWNID